jgi:hypothetical protein
MQRNGFQPLVSLAQTRAQKADGRHRHLRVALDQFEERLLRQRHRLDARNGRGACRALAAVECGDLAEYIARSGMVEGKFAAVARQDGQADAALEHEIDLTSRIAARKDHLIGVELNAAHASDDGFTVSLAKRAE